MAPIIGVKCYGFDWMTRLGLDERSAARLMASHGVDWALIQNTMDPLPTSGVAQVQPAHYDERRFRDELRNHGIKTYESTAVFFQPDMVAAEPDLRPVADDGSPMEMFDWYLGVSPHSRDYLARRVELMERVVATHDPDGVFLVFIRFPGFWEGWTPRVARDQIHDYGFAPGSTRRFAEDTGIDLPDADPATVARVVLAEHMAEWVRWKCDVVTDAAAQLAEAARRARPGTETLINGLAFPRADRGDLGREVLGQDLGAISGVAEHVETMIYHQILGRDTDAWVAEVVEDLRPRVAGTLLPSLQTSVAYTEPPHHTAGRAAELPPSEVVDVLRSVARTAADGVTVYHWTDIADEEINGDGVMAAGLRAYKEGSL
ncbi:hypothetical protein OEB99_08550 [Actinotalea sp. M2MS4P-6]|uniref:hypothetical protein n=1 Tax=Actinotalea sp. M2MS4P-6 TaxID=2983762 RepID=UPI0021E3D87A|nr:hypothetical protein [Actinotalea sp. M2MS4P-6]MCV2394357.1 hypothetical protein [Actinotalea sp. M2MS4P-6]